MSSLIPPLIGPNTILTTQTSRKAAKDERHGVRQRGGSCNPHLSLMSTPYESVHQGLKRADWKLVMHEMAEMKPKRKYVQGSFAKISPSGLGSEAA